MVTLSYTILLLGIPLSPGFYSNHSYIRVYSRFAAPSTLVGGELGVFFFVNFPPLANNIIYERTLQLPAAAGRARDCESAVEVA